MLDEGGVEAPHAGKTAGQRHLGHGQPGIGEQLLGHQQPPCLQVLQRGDAQGGVEQAAQMAIAHAEAGSQLRHLCAALQGATGWGRIQQAQRLAHQDGARILHRPGERLRCQLRSAAQAGPKTCMLGLRRQVKEAAVFAPRRAYRADGAAINAG